MESGAGGIGSLSDLHVRDLEGPVGPLFALVVDLCG